MISATHFGRLKIVKVFGPNKVFIIYLFKIKTYVSRLTIKI